MATEHEVDRLVVRLTGDQSAYQRMITQVEKQTEEAANWAQKMGAKITDSFTSAFRTAQGMLSSVGSASIKGGAALTGMSAAITAPLGKAALDFSSYGEGLATIVRQTDDAAKSAALLKRELKDNTVAFKELSEVIELTEKQAATYKMMSDRTGLSIKTLSDTIKTNTEEYKKWEAEAEKFGLVLTKDQIKAATDLAESWTRVKQSLRGLWVQVGEAVGKGFKDWNDLIVGIITRTTQWVKENKALIQTVATIAEKAAAVGTVLVGVGTALSTVSTFLAPIAAMVAAGAAAWLAWDTATGKFLKESGVEAWNRYKESITSVYNQVVDYGKRIVAFVDQITVGVFDAIKAGNLELAVKILWSGAKVTWVSSLNELGKLTKEAFGSIFQGLSVNGLNNALEGSVTKIKVLWDKLLAEAEPVFAKIRSIAASAWSYITENLGGALTDVQRLLGGLSGKFDSTAKGIVVGWTFVKTFFQELGTSISETWNRTLTAVGEIASATAKTVEAVFQNVAAGDWGSAWKAISNSVKITFLEIEKAADPLWVKMEESFVKVAAIIKKAWNEVYFFIIDIVQKLMAKLGQLLEKLGTSSLVKFVSPEMAQGSRELGLSLREARTKMLEGVLEPDTSADQAREDFDKAKKELEDKKKELEEEREKANKSSFASRTREAYQEWKKSREAEWGTHLKEYREWRQDSDKAWGAKMKQGAQQTGTSYLPSLDVSGGMRRLGATVIKAPGQIATSGSMAAVGKAGGWLLGGMVKDAKDFANFSMETIKGSSRAERAQAEKDLKAAEEQVVSKKKELDKLEEQYSEANLKKRIAESKETRGRGISEEETGKLLNIRASAEKRTAKIIDQITKLKKEQEELVRKGNEEAAKRLKSEQEILDTQLKQVKAEKEKADQALVNAQATAEKSNAERRAQEEALRISKEKEAIEERFKDPIKKYNEDLEKVNKLFKDGEREGRAYKEAVKALQRELLSSNFNVNVHFGMTGLDAVKHGTQEWLAIVENGLKAIQDEKTLKKAEEQAAGEKAKADKEALEAEKAAAPGIAEVQTASDRQRAERAYGLAALELNELLEKGPLTAKEKEEEEEYWSSPLSQAGVMKRYVRDDKKKAADKRIEALRRELEQYRTPEEEEIAAHTEQMTVLLGASSQDRNRAEKAVNPERELQKATKPPELTVGKLLELPEGTDSVMKAQVQSDRQRAERARPVDLPVLPQVPAAMLPPARPDEPPSLANFPERAARRKTEEDVNIAEVQAQSDRQSAERIVPANLAVMPILPEPQARAPSRNQEPKMYVFDAVEAQARAERNKANKVATIEQKPTKPRQTAEELEAKRINRDIRRQEEKDRLAASVRERGTEPIRRSGEKSQRGAYASRKKTPSKKTVVSKPPVKESDIDKRSLAALLEMSTAMQKLTDRPVVQLEPLGVTG